MGRNLADRLRAARQTWFVGRAAELDLFQSALAARELPYPVLYVFGPGGVGKTALLSRFADLCEQAGIPYARVDGRETGCSPAAFLESLGRAMGLDPAVSPQETLAGQPGRYFIFVDGYDALDSLDPWIVGRFLPATSADVLVVLAGHHPPGPAWRTDPGWQSLVQTLPLRNLNPEESRAYLTQRGVPAGQHGRALLFTRGFPLALSLIADVFRLRPDAQFDPQAEPDVVRAILERLLVKTPGPGYRTALEMCALVRVTTEQLLAETLEAADAYDLFDWLRGLSFVESSPAGLHPHDVARQALLADLRWRNPDRYADLHARARRYYSARIQEAGRQSLEAAVIDYIYLHRENPVVRPFYEQLRAQGRGLGEVAVAQPRPADGPAVLEMVRRHEGDRAAGIAKMWLDQPATDLLLLRGPDERPAGFMLTLALEVAPPEVTSEDPAAKVAWAHLQAYAPLRSGETALYFRFWMVGDTYQAISPLQSLIFVHMALKYLTTPGLAFSFLACAEPDFWAPLFAYAELARIPEADFTVGGKSYGVFGHDWRAQPPILWLDLLAERELLVTYQETQRVKEAQPLLVLSQPDFAGAVQEALKVLTRPDRLRENPLLRSRLALDETRAEAGEAKRIDTLRARIEVACRAVGDVPGQEKYFHALELTYLNPAPTQELAASQLGIPFRTFRRHLKSGIQAVTEILWRWEIGVES